MNRAKLVALLAPAALAILSLRDAIVRSSLPDRPEQAVRIWPAHPDAVIASQMTAIGEAARARRPISDGLIGPVVDAARRSPLSIEPFLVAGVNQQTSGNEEVAGRLFLAAAQRDPRAVAPHLFLSAHYSKSGKGTKSLTELGRVVRLVPGSSAQLAPQIAAALKQSGGPTIVRALVAQNAELREDVVRAMSTDAANLNFVLTLQSPGASRDWVPIMIGSLITARQYERAFALWASANRVALSVQNRPALLDPGFRLTMPAPFGWTVAMAPSSGEAVTNPSGGIHVTSFGGEIATVLSQTILLRPGNYLLHQGIRSRVGDPSVLAWQVSCLGTSIKISTIPLSRNRAAGRFSVPSNCDAQQIDLIATPAEFPEKLDAILSPVVLRRVP